MSDKQLRSKLGGLEGFAFDQIPWTAPKPLHESRVAIVTTAGLRVEDDADWNAGDQGFAEIPRDAEDLTLANYSHNFDRVGWVRDKNGDFPIYRLQELAEEGRIGYGSAHNIRVQGEQREHPPETNSIARGA